MDMGRRPGGVINACNIKEVCVRASARVPREIRMTQHDFEACVLTATCAFERILTTPWTINCKREHAPPLPKRQRRLR